jgi:2,3-bisphosphoglycerate-independent phosphoglycerate mutase
MSDSKRRVLLIFVDGIGIGVKDAARNPCFAAHPRFLLDLLAGQLPSSRNRTIESPDALCIPADANLGVAGLPQSGTGQATLYTGINCPRIIKQHFGPYLYSTLKPVVDENNIFETLQKEDPPFSVAFANAFPQRFFDYLQGPRRRMVAGMYAALVSGVPFRGIQHLKRGEGISTDMTAERWDKIGHPDAPVITPYLAGRTLASIAAQYDFTLYEYFQTDKAGHKRDMEYAIKTIRNVDALLRGVYEHTDLEHTLVILTSDHGNIEDLSIKTHTRNPVPVLMFGNRIGFDHRSILSIAHIVPAIRSFLLGS